MSVVVKNKLSTVLDVPGAGLMFQPSQELTVDSITPALSAAIQNGHVEVVSQSDATTVTVEENGQTTFALPFPWPGPDLAHLVVGGLVQTFGTDFTVDAETNELLWLDAEVELEEGDVLLFVRRAP